MSPINAYLIKMVADQRQRDLRVMAADNRRVSLIRRNRRPHRWRLAFRRRRQPTPTTVEPAAMSFGFPGLDPVQRIRSEAGGDVDHLDGVSTRTA